MIPNELTAYQYAVVVRLLNESRELRARAHAVNLTLEQKLDLLHRADHAYAKARAIGWRPE